MFEELSSSAESLTEEKIAFYMEQIISCVSYMHQQGICHRDIKPENFLFENQEKKLLKLIDFGTTIHFKNYNFLSYIKGTSAYMAPEVIRKNYNEKCDIWSCGIILYLALTGRWPFNGITDEERMNKILNNELTFEGCGLTKKKFGNCDLLNQRIL